MTGSSVVNVCVIGAGAAGLCATRHLLDYNKRIERRGQVRVTLFEKSLAAGGLWNYDGEAHDSSHSSIYEGLKTNLPKEIMGFPDFPFAPSDHSFLGHQEVAEYLKSYAKHFDLNQVIRLGTTVKSVNHMPSSSTSTAWLVKTEGSNFEEEEQEFDVVVVCNGHFTKPNMPTIEGSEKFKGTITHSHTYRKPDVFSGKRVVVAGLGASGTDIALEICSVADKVYLSHNKSKHPGHLPENLVQCGVISECTGPEDFTLEDGSLISVDALVQCTGYAYDFPFLRGCGLEWSTSNVGPLYKHIVNINYPSMFFIGLISKTCPFPSFDVQARFMVNHLTGSVSLPCQETMRKDLNREIEEHRKCGKPLRHFHVLLDTQWKYCRQLSNLGLTGNLPDFYEEIFEEVFERRYHNLTSYRKDNWEKIDNYQINKHGSYNRN